MKRTLHKYLIEFEYTTHHQVNVEALSPQDALVMLNEKLWDARKEEADKFLKETIDDDDPYYQSECEAKVLYWPEDDELDDYIPHPYYDDPYFEDPGEPDLVAVQRSHLEHDSHFRCELPFKDSQVLLEFLKEKLVDDPDDFRFDRVTDGYYVLLEEKDQYRHSIKRMYNVIKSGMRENTPVPQCVADGKS